MPLTHDYEFGSSQHWLCNQNDDVVYYLILRLQYAQARHPEMWN